MGEYSKYIDPKRRAVPTPKSMVDEKGICAFGTFDKEFEQMDLVKLKKPTRAPQCMNRLKLTLWEATEVHLKTAFFWRLFATWASSARRSTSSTTNARAKFIAGTPTSNQKTPSLPPTSSTAQSRKDKRPYLTSSTSTTSKTANANFRATTKASAL